MLRETLAPRQQLCPGLPLSARLIARLLGRIRAGTLELSFDGGCAVRLVRTETPRARVHIRRPLALLRRCLLRGAVGFAESYMAGDWDSPQLVRLLGLLAQNQHQLSGAIRLAPGLWLDRLRHRLRANSRRGSRRNVRAHYDLSNDFYRLWLDPSMTYSCAVFEDPATGAAAELPRAQQRKYAQILGLTQARTGERILEIGCGWGGFAHAAAERGVNVTGITLSPAQLAYAQARLAGTALPGQVELRLQDYRDIQGRFDHIVSIEMLEAVGEAYWPEYFATLARSLRPGGRAVLQVIVIDDARLERYRRQPDFIQMHVFPGGMLPSRQRLKQLAAAVGLCWQLDRSLGLHYARTCALWDQDVTRHEQHIRSLGFDDAFLRRWHYYLRYCQAGFELGMIDVLHIALRKPPDAD
ncbi:MAG: cyclopropane-fatty-acyl-phospholipid synthase family protein [Gammaproteobacteria bacterium]|jgi:cyclopropane-fatty-acyl-phospholipid synthase